MGLNPGRVSGWSSEQMASYMAGLESAMRHRGGDRPPWEVADIEQIDEAMTRIIDAAETVRQLCSKLLTTADNRR